jgi:hypothetical protein
VRASAGEHVERPGAHVTGAPGPRPIARDRVVAAALALDRTNVLAHLVDASLLGSIAPEEARDTATAHPNDWRAWWLLGSAVRQGPEAAEALDKLCDLAESDVPECARPRPTTDNPSR